MDNNREPRSSMDPNGSGSPRLGYGRIFIWILLLLLVVPWLFRMSGFGQQPGNRISYSEFRTQLEQGQVQRVTVQGEEIRGKLVAPNANQPEPSASERGEFVTYLPAFGDEKLMDLLREKNVEIQVQPATEGNWWLVVSSLLPFVLFVGIGLFIFRRMRSQGQNLFAMGQNKAKLYDRRDEKTMFDDVAGAEGAKNELREIIEYLKEPARFRVLGGKPPKGVLLVGPPGTGKTLLARATAGEAGVPFFSITGSDFMEMFVGVGASRVRSLFADARKAAPAIIFIDELDSIGRRRGAGLGGGHDEREQTLNQLLAAMDGFETQEGVIVMAATNRPDILDSALLRPGRFDRRVTVDLPGVEARKAILRVHTRNKPLADEVDLAEIARGTPGFAGADLENLLNEAALMAARKRKVVIDREAVEEARDKILLGLEREGLMLTEDDKRALAYHEAGHAVVAAIMPNADPLHKVTIVPRGRAMGNTQQMPDRERYVYTREYLLDRMAVMMGGRAAESLVLNTATSGAESDLHEAMHLARKMVLDWGMSERLTNIALGGKREHVFLGGEISEGREYSETTAREVDEEVKRLLDDAYEMAESTLRRYRKALDKLAQTLVEREEILREDLMRIIHDTEPRDSQPVPVNWR